jgi:hypothetical protein
MDLNRCIQKLNERPEPEDRLKLIYEWTKTGHLNLSEFRTLVMREICLTLVKALHNAFTLPDESTT